MQPKYLGPFRIFEVVGRGGMGAVYEAIHTETLEKAAVKVLLSPVEEDEELRLRFEAEIETLKQLRHPNIVRLFGFGEEQQVLYYVMEFVAGRSLQQELRQKRFFAWEEACKIGLEMSQALKHAHDRGIIHRDIKPANILLEYSGIVKLSDFGIAHIYGEHRLTHVNSVVGTLEYMSPEQAQAGPIGPKTDLYSLGVVLYTLLVGTPPYQAKTLPEILQKHQSGSPQKISETRPDVPEIFESIIMELLNIKPDARPTNAYILGRRLEVILKAYIGNAGLVKVRPSENNSEPIVRPALIAPSQLQETSTHVREAEDSDHASSAMPLKKRNPSHSRKDHLQMSLDEFQFELSSPSKTYGNSEHEADGKKPTTKSRTHRLSSRRFVQKNGLTKSRHFFQNFLKEPLAESKNPKPRSYVDLPARVPTPGSVNPLDTLNETEPTTGKRSRFIQVHEDELGSFSKYEEQTQHKAVSMQTIFLSISLLGIGFFLYYLLLPVSADTLYNRINQAIGADNAKEDGSLNVARLAKAESNIELFLDLYPNDPRREQMSHYIEEIKLEKLQQKMQREFDFRINRLQNADDLQPLERLCLEAFTLARTQPEKAVAKLQAILDLYGSNLEPLHEREEISSDEPSPAEKTKTGSEDMREGRPRSESQYDLYLELVRRRLLTIQDQLTTQIEEQKKFLQNRLDKAAEINWILPEQADKIRHGIIEIYRDTPWAATFVERAKDEIGGQ